MTEDQKLTVYIDETLQIDRNDAVNSQRIHDIVGAWKMRASEPPPITTDWSVTVREVLAFLQLPMAETPTQATGQIIAMLSTLRQAVDQANVNMQGLAYRDEVIKNQSNILDAFATLLKLENGKFYMDMVPMLQALVEPKPVPDPDPQTPVQ